MCPIGKLIKAIATTPGKSGDRTRTPQKGSLADRANKGK